MKFIIKNKHPNIIQLDYEKKHTFNYIVSLGFDTL